MARDRTLTEQLQVFFQGDQSGVDAILEEVLPRLHEIAVRHLNGEQGTARGPRSAGCGGRRKSQEFETAAESN